MAGILARGEGDKRERFCIWPVDTIHDVSGRCITCFIRPHGSLTDEQARASACIGQCSVWLPLAGAIK